MKRSASRSDERRRWVDAKLDLVTKLLDASLEREERPRNRAHVSRYGSRIHVEAIRAIATIVSAALSDPAAPEPDDDGGGEEVTT